MNGPNKVGDEENFMLIKLDNQKLQKLIVLQINDNLNCLSMFQSQCQDYDPKIS